MTKAELIERIARSRNLPPGITKKDIALILGITFDELASYFAKTKVTRSTSPRFTFPRFGTFTKKKRSARRGVNPRTLEPMQIDACCTVDFKASKELRDQMNGAASSKSGANKAATKRKTTKTAAKKTGSPKSGTKKSGTQKSGTQTSGTQKNGTRKAAKTSTKSASGKKKASATKRSRLALSGRRLTPRDEDAELDALIDDDSLFVELPASRLQRVRPHDDDAAETA